MENLQLIENFVIDLWPLKTVGHPHQYFYEDGKNAGE
jgi:hypothetical protein